MVKSIVIIFQLLLKFSYYYLQICSFGGLWKRNQKLPECPSSGCKTLQCLVWAGNDLSSPREIWVLRASLPNGFPNKSTFFCYNVLSWDSFACFTGWAICYFVYNKCYYLWHLTTFLVNCFYYLTEKWRSYRDDGEGYFSWQEEPSSHVS